MPGVLLIETHIFRDERGRFLEAWHDERYSTGVTRERLVQDNVSVSCRGAVRGLHFQYPHQQGKLISVLAGAVFDVVLDVRPGSRTFGRWIAEELTGENGRQLWIPNGFAHGFQALADGTVFVYKCTDVYHPECERTVRFDDPVLGITWPLPERIVSPRDAAAPTLAQLPAESLPPFP